MRTPNPRISTAWWALIAAGLAAGAGMSLFYAPVEATMGPIQKIFYVHLPSAINTFVACMLVFIASVGYLMKRQSWWDDLAAAAAQTAVLLCTIVLLTGMIWGKVAWGSWWTWSPRLTFSLLLWMLYVVYLLIRASIDGAQRRALLAAVYGVVAFLDVPLVYLSARMLPDIHPSSIKLESSMKLTLAVCFVPVTMLMVALVTAGYRRRRAAAAAATPEDALGAAPMKLDLLTQNPTGGR